MGSIYARQIRRITDALDGVSAQGRGSLVVASSDDPDVCDDLLAETAKEVSSVGTSVVHLRVVRGQLLVANDSNRRPEAWDYTIQASKVIASGAQLVDQVRGGLLAFASELASLSRMRRPWGREPDSYSDMLPASLNKVSRALSDAARARTVLVIAERMDDIDFSVLWWDAFIAIKLPEILKQSRILFVCGVTRYVVGAQRPAVQLMDQYLIPEGLATEIPIGPSRDDDIENLAGPLSSDLATTLIVLSGGNQVLLKSAWAELLRDGDVQQWNGTWNLNRSHSSAGIVDNWILQRLVEYCNLDVDAVRYARRMLSYGAMQGRTFCANVVATVVNEDLDDLVDFIDDRLLGSGQVVGVLVDDGFTTVGGSASINHLQNYSFTSATLWRALRIHGKHEIDDYTNTCRAFANALCGAYFPDLAPVRMAIIRLAALGDDQPLVTYAETIADQIASIDLARGLAGVLLESFSTVQSVPILRCGMLATTLANCAARAQVSGRTSRADRVPKADVSRRPLRTVWDRT